MVNKINIGDRAPDFSLPDTHSRIRYLKEFLGQNLVLVFFVAGFTSTCTKERCEFRDSMAQLINLNVEIVGIDLNMPSANKDLAEKNRLPFPVLSDHKREVFKKYGLEVPEFVGAKGESIACCWGKGCFPIAKRSIFVLDQNGLVRYKWVSGPQSVEPDYEEIKKVLGQTVLVHQAPRLPDVITISRQIGSGGDEIALKVSEILGYAYFDKNLMLSVAKSIGVSDEELANLSEDEYMVKSFIDKIFLRKKPPVLKDRLLTGTKLDEKEYLSLIQTVINSLASRGKTVIVGRGAQAILKNKAGVLHVRIVASQADRIERLMKSKGLSQADAMKLMQDSDKIEAEYLRRFYNIEWADPINYHIVFNTSKMDLDVIARVIVSVVL